MCHSQHVQVNSLHTRNSTASANRDHIASGLGPTPTPPSQSEKYLACALAAVVATHSIASRRPRSLRVAVYNIY